MAAKQKNLSKLGVMVRTRWFTVMLFIIGFAGVGAYLLLQSHAATPETTLYGSVSPSSFYVNDKLPNIVQDSWYEASGSTADYPSGIVASFGDIAVAELKAGDKLTYPGKGGEDSTQPAWVSTRSCYVIKNTTSTTVTVSIASGRTARRVDVRPAPSKFEDAYWTYNCVTDTKTSGDFVPYSLKELSGGLIHVYRIDIYNTLAY